MFGSANSFRPNFTKPPKTFLWNFFLQIFFHKDHENFFVSPPNESLLLFFCKRLVPFFKWTLAAVLLRFSEILPGFLICQTFWESAFTRCTPPIIPLVIWVAVSDLFEEQTSVHNSNCALRIYRLDYIAFVTTCFNLKDMETRVVQNSVDTTSKSSETL